ncbi:MAG: L,D-transpeptidase family protein, partial [Ginsengibacter sp.]
VVIFFASCENKHAAKEKEIVETPEQLNGRVSDNMKAVLLYSLDNKGKINDSSRLRLYEMVHEAYKQSDFKRIWSHHDVFLPQADLMMGFIKTARYFGLYPEDYHAEELNSLFEKIETDSLARKDAVLWTKAELLLSDAFMQTLKDLKEGRMLPDSISIIQNKKMIDSFFVRKWNDIQSGESVTEMLLSVQPKHTDYHLLQQALKAFVDTMEMKKYHFIVYPNSDSLDFTKKIYARLTQSGFGNAQINNPDFDEYTRALTNYQVSHSLTPDGKAGPAVVKSLNSYDMEKFRRIAVTLDRYKSTPPFPETYILVNIPSFYLKLIDADTVVMTSKVVVGKPATSTPELTSSISNMVTYPQWTIPASIIRQDILPRLKKDPGYLFRKGYSLVDEKGETVNPYEVDWSKYTKWIPWRVVQGSGDDNALGVFKFNFNNPYSVYLHDTNQRYLFKNKDRALSHGCVRVEKWHALASFIAKRDSTVLKPNQLVGYNMDSINTWISNKTRKTIMIKKRLPLIINYMTCVAQNGKIIVFDDIYKEDYHLERKYFANN